MSQWTDSTTRAGQRFRTLFLTDLHLGAMGCRADLILEFLNSHQAETYILAGDVLDLWHPLLPYWRDADQAVIDHFRARHAEGARICYLVGNHDPLPDTAPEHAHLPVPAGRELVHDAANGQSYLVVHGDVCDSRLFRAHFMTRIGSRIDHMLRCLDHRLRRWRRLSGPEMRSSLERALSWLNTLMHRSRSHERRLTAMAAERGLDGVICGHFHIAELHDDHGVIYANCGDWVDSYTALAERFDGSLCLLGGREAMAASGQGASRPELAGA